MPEIKENFFRTPVTMPVIQWVNDPEYRTGFGHWLYENFDSLAEEYKKHGRFLTAKEIYDSPLEFSDKP